MSAVPSKLRASLMALVLLSGAGGGYYLIDDAAKQEAQRNAYIQAVAADPDVSEAIKIAMVMASYYESSNRHIGTPYIDKLGKGRPLTVCNGITGAVAQIDPKRYYSPEDCYQLEKKVFVRTANEAEALTTTWARLTAYQQASIIDFIHSVGAAKYASSTMRRKFNAGDIAGGCAENPRWRYANGKVLPGLVVRRGSNAEICATWEGGL